MYYPEAVQKNTKKHVKKPSKSIETTQETTNSLGSDTIFMRISLSGENPIKFTDPDGNKLTPILLRGAQGTAAHNTAYALVDLRITSLGYVSKFNSHMRNVSGTTIIAGLRPDFQGFGREEVSYWELKQGSKKGLASAIKDIGFYIDNAKKLGINARAGEALNVIAEMVPMAGSPDIFLNIYSPIDGIIIYDAFKYEPDQSPQPSTAKKAATVAITIGIIMLTIITLPVGAPLTN